MEWLRFNPDFDAKILNVTILMGPFIEYQPTRKEDVDAFCQSLYPILDQIQELCKNHGMTQVCTTDLSGIKIKKLKPVIMMKVIWNIYEHTKDCILLSKCEIAGGGTLAGSLLVAVRGLLPPFMRNMVQLIPDQNQDYKGDEESDDDSEFLECITDEVI